ncbi:MAG: helix-turn-helix domain-containing protein [Gemmatimonadaceae bacterium]
MRTSPFLPMECPIARSLAQVGDGWRVLVLRDALLGFRRFDEFELSLGIAPNILTQRLNALVADGLLEKKVYQHRPVRSEYIPTPKAREFATVIAALASWGTRWLSPEGEAVMIVDRTSGEPVEAAMIGRSTKHICRTDNLKFQPGPHAGTEILTRAERLQARTEKKR